MEIEPNLTQVDFQIAVNSFHDELINKLEYFNTVEIQLLRRFECNINMPQTHSELVFYLRNMIQLIEEAFKDVESYFSDLKMNFLYDYFRKIQMLMVNGFNFLSQALIIQIDQNEKEREYKAKSKEMQKIVIRQNSKQPVKTLKEQAKQLEHYDFAINFYENEQAKITEELHRMQENIMMSKGLIDKLHPSKAVKQLEQIKQRAEITLENTQKIFEETYQLKYLEFKQYLSKLQKPEDVTKDFCDHLKLAMRDKFEIGMKKSVNVLFSLRKQDDLSKLKDECTQTDEIQIPTVAKLEKKITCTSKNGEKLHTLLIRQRKLTEKLLSQLQVAKKQSELLIAERLRLQILYKQSEVKNRESQSNYQILSKIYDQKRQEITILKKSLGQYDLVIDRLRGLEIKCLKEFALVESSVQTEEFRQFASKEIQANMQDNEIIVILKKTNEKMGQKIREKEIRIKEIEKKQISEKKEKMGRLRISQAISPEVMAFISNRFSNQQDISSPVSSQKSILSNVITQEKQPTQKPEQSSGRKNSKIIKPSNFSIKRFSSKQNILNKQKNKPPEVATQVCFGQNQGKIYTCKYIQVEIATQPNEPATKDDQFNQPDGYKTQLMSRNRSIELLNQKMQEKRFIKKHLTHSKDRIWKKQSSAQTNREACSVSNRYQAFMETEEPPEDRLACFQNLNLQSQECKLALQKRGALSKKFMLNIKRKQKVIGEIDQKNKTCIGEFYNSRRNDDNYETKHLICIDKIGLNKKNSKKYEKTSVMSKPSQKSIKCLDKQNFEKYSKIK